jgi:hypothetical protein
MSDSILVLAAYNRGQSVLYIFILNVWALYWSVCDEVLYELLNACSRVFIDYCTACWHVNGLKDNNVSKTLVIIKHFPSTVHRLGVGKAVVMGEQVALSVLLPFLCNIFFCFCCTAQTLYQCLLIVVLAYSSEYEDGCLLGCCAV